ncbi:MAG: hypothetical protein WEF50_03185 [Myxococcota bacterium]
MNRTVANSLGIIGSCLSLAACEARPIPMQVIPNSTFMLPLHARGFGNEVSISQGVQDRQRGDLIVAICPPENVWCMPVAAPFPPPCPTPPAVPPDGYYLDTRYVTTVMPHPGSNAGIAGLLDFPSYGSDWGLVGQDLALLDVPSEVCPGTYELSVRTRPVGSFPSAPDEVGYAAGVDIVVLDVPPGATNPTWANPFGTLDVPIDADLADLVPNPEVPLNLLQLGWTSTYPAAAEIDVGYPTSRVEILSAYQGQHLGIHSLVSWWDDPVASKVTITVIDPKRCTNDIRLVFRLLDGEAAVDPMVDFTTAPENQRLYDLNGSLLSGNPYVIANPDLAFPRCGSD